MRKPFVLSVLLLSSFLLPLASVVAQVEAPKCDGDVTIVRVSKLKPGGTMEGFDKAVEMHRAFYRANGVKDNEIVTARVILRDPDTGAMSWSSDQILSLHIRPPFQQTVPGRGDAAYDAFVKQYRDNSEIVSETLACVPKHAP